MALHAPETVSSNVTGFGTWSAIQDMGLATRFDMG